MGCSNSKAAIAKNAQQDNGTKLKKGDSNSSMDSLDKDRNKKNGDGENDSELSDEEIELLEKEQREQIWVEKENLRDRVHTENMMQQEYYHTLSAEKSASDMLQQEEEMALMNSNAIRLQKQTLRRLLKRKAEKEQKWMVFSNPNCFDEADMTNLTDFLTKVMHTVPCCVKVSVQSRDTEGNEGSDSDVPIVEVEKPPNFGPGNAVVDYLFLKNEKSYDNGMKHSVSTDDIRHILEQKSSFDIDAGKNILSNFLPFLSFFMLIHSLDIISSISLITF